MILSKFLLLVVAVTGLVLTYLWARRRRFNDYKQFPQPKTDLLWGHSKVLNQYISKGRPKENIDISFRRIIKDLSWPEVCLFDVRPFQPRPLMLITSPELADQFAKPSAEFKYSFPKSETLSFLRPLIGTQSILTYEGEQWKRLRTRLNPAFSRSHLITFLPIIAAKSRQFLGILNNLAATKESFCLDHLTTALTFDIIGAVVLGIDFHAQEGMDNAHPLYKRFAEVAKCFADDSIVKVMNPVRRWEKSQAGKRLDAATKKVILSTVSALRQKDKVRSRSVLELSLQGVDNLTDEALQEAADAQKTFLFAGHDTTSITLQWALYELSRFPAVFHAVEAELDAVFGTDSDPAGVLEQIVEQGDGILRKLTYVRAMVKETLRLYPPASSARQVPPTVDYWITLPETGEQVNLKGITLYINHDLIGRNPKVYGSDADCFRPERWLEASTKDHVPESAWRPFERGPRSCIGQELSNIEAVVILACVARHYRFHKVGVGAFDVGPDGKHVLDPATGAYQTSVAGEMYCRRQITSRPVDDMVMTVSKRRS